MGGYFGTPQRTLKKQVGDVEFTIHRVASILNSRDPDVSFAYTFCGSMGCSLDGKSDLAKEAAERGRQKAQIEYHDPEWRGLYDRWAQSLIGLGKHKIDLWDYGYAVPDCCLVDEMDGMAYNINLSADEIIITLNGVLVGTQGTIKPGGSCFEWMKEQEKEIKKADRNVHRAIRKPGWFLIGPDEDD